MTFRTTDLLDANPLLEACDAGLVHYGGRHSFAGRAATLRCFDDNSQVRELLREPGHGRVLVVDGGGSRRCALVGDLLAAAAVEHGWAGIVVNGCIRDSAAVGALDLGVLALGVMPRRSEKHGQGVRDTPLQILGARVNPGDWVYADEDGVVFSPRALTP